MVLLANSWIGLTAPLFMYFLLRKLVTKEEIYLENIFGSEYIEYKKGVPCILPFGCLKQSLRGKIWKFADRGIQWLERIKRPPSVRRSSFNNNYPIIESWMTWKFQQYRKNVPAPCKGAFRHCSLKPTNKKAWNEDKIPCFSYLCGHTRCWGDGVRPKTCDISNNHQDIVLPNIWDTQTVSLKKVGWTELGSPWSFFSRTSCQSISSLRHRWFFPGNAVWLQGLRAEGLFCSRFQWAPRTDWHTLPHVFWGHGVWEQCWPICRPFLLQFLQPRKKWEISYHPVSGRPVWHIDAISRQSFWE